MKNGDRDRHDPESERRKRYLYLCFDRAESVVACEDYKYFAQQRCDGIYLRGMFDGG